MEVLLSLQSANDRVHSAAAEGTDTGDVRPVMWTTHGDSKHGAEELSRGYMEDGVVGDADHAAISSPVTAFSLEY
jgi:hypothetical protein